MLIAATKLEHLPIIDPDTHERLGTIESSVFDPDRGTFVALHIKKSGLLREHRYVAAVDVQSFENHAVLCSGDCLTPLNELPRVKEIVEQKRPVLGQHAKTVSNTNLGKVGELMFDDATDGIVQFHTQLLFQHRIFRFEDVVKVTKKAVIFTDDQAEIKNEEAVPAEVTIA